MNICVLYHQITFSTANDLESLNSKEDISHKLTISSKFQKLRYLSRLHLQLGAVLSQINKHEEALQHGKTAALYCQDLIKNTELLCKDYIDQLEAKRGTGKGKDRYLNSPPARRNSAKRYECKNFNYLGSKVQKPLRRIKITKNKKLTNCINSKPKKNRRSKAQKSHF